MSSHKKIAVILSGCGVFDGAEIHESVLTMLAIARAGASYQCYAPDKKQAHVINHLTGEEMPESRNVLTEAARIARGDIKPLNDLQAGEFDGIIFPGGFGAAKNLSTFAFEGPDCEVEPGVESVVKEAVDKGVPIGALCISPAMVVKILPGADVTIGKDKGTADAIIKMGGTHHETDHGEVIIDEKYKLVTTPCYMLDATISQIADGAENVVNELLKL
jgi:enhancing lycopene biosynthesis protein 2